MSEEKSRASHLVEDLSVLSRRGALSVAERQVLADALESNLALSTAHQVGCDFDQVAAVKPGDDALIAEVAGRVVARRERGVLGGHFRVQALLLVAALVSAGSAAAWWQQRSRAPHALPANPALTRPATSSARPVAGSPVSVVSSARELLHEPPAAPAATPNPASTRAVALPERAQVARADEPVENVFASAEALFREANAARRSGDRAGARALYLRLEHDFPSSDEAHLAHVSLGNLLLSMGRAREAEEQFASYLGGRPALAQEALVGRAQSLAALRQSDEERRVWEGLLHDYPSSVYAVRAKQRLAELTHQAASPK